MTAKRNSRNPWPVSIAACFLVFVAFLATFIVFAARQHVDLVRGDYYEQEIRFQEQLDRVARSRECNDKTEITYDAARHCIDLKLPASPNQLRTGRIHFYRPSDAALDRVTDLALKPDGTQRLDAGQLRSGLWKVRIEWTTEGQEYYVDRPLVIPALKRS